MTATATTTGTDGVGDPDGTPAGHDAAVPPPVVVRRNAGLAALIGAAASATAIAYLYRATASGAALDWALCAVMALIGAAYLAQLVDARTPLLVADDLGVRIRFGRQWRGLPWDAVAEVVVTPSRGPLRDGRLVVRPHSLARAVEGLDARGRRAARLNQRLYDAALAVPVGLTTRTSVRGEALERGLSELAHGRTDLVVLRPHRSGDPAGPATVEQSDDSQAVDSHPDQSHPDQSQGDYAHGDHSRADDSHGDGAHADRAGADGLGDGVGALGLGGWFGQDVDEDGAADEDVDEDAGSGRVSRRGRRARQSWGALTARFAARRRTLAHDDASDRDGEVVDEGRVDDGAAPADREEQPAFGGAIPLRDHRQTLHADLGPSGPAATIGSAALLRDTPGVDRRGSALPELEELRRRHEDPADHPGGLAEDPAEGFSVLGERPSPVSAPVLAPGDPRVRPIARLGEPVEPLVVDDFVTEPAYDPVIGPELAAARTRVGLSVDELAERTRIRPHVIESIEVDDFAPCGGDFYARGHLRTLARVLGRDPGPLLAVYEQRYAAAPINARRVFEAELATGMTGSMRRTTGTGPNWVLLIGVVLALVLTWGVVRLFDSEPPEVLRPAPVLDGSAGLGAGAVKPDRAPAAVPPPIRVRLTGAAPAGSQVVVRDRSGTVVWAGTIPLGAHHSLRATPPVRVRAVDAGAVDVAVDGTGRGAVGPAGRTATRTLRAPH